MEAEEKSTNESRFTALPALSRITGRYETEDRERERQGQIERERRERERIEETGHIEDTATFEVDRSQRYHNRGENRNICTTHEKHVLTFASISLRTSGSFRIIANQLSRYVLKLLL